MGLFRKKEKIPDGIRVVYYEGELPGFSCNYACQLLLTNDELYITKIKPYVEVRLARERILSMDILPEIEYMKKFKGNAPTQSSNKVYYVLNYLDKIGNKKHMDFWGTTFEDHKMRRLQQELISDSQSHTYEI